MYPVEIYVQVRRACMVEGMSVRECPASTIFAGWRQSVLPVHLLGLDALLGSVGPVAGTSNSRMTEWCTTRSIAAAVAMGLAKMRSHSEKTRFDVMPNDRRS